MPNSTKKQPKRWVYSPRKPAPPKISPLLKAEVTDQGQALVDTYLKPTYVKSPPENPDHNHKSHAKPRRRRGEQGAPTFFLAALRAQRAPGVSHLVLACQG